MIEINYAFFLINFNSFPIISKK